MDGYSIILRLPEYFHLIEERILIHSNDVQDIVSIISWVIFTFKNSQHHIQSLYQQNERCKNESISSSIWHRAQDERQHNSLNTSPILSSLPMSLLESVSLNSYRIQTECEARIYELLSILVNTGKTTVKLLIVFFLMHRVVENELSISELMQRNIGILKILKILLNFKKNFSMRVSILSKCDER